VALRVVMLENGKARHSRLPWDKHVVNVPDESVDSIVSDMYT
jgi:hypothetical protein